MNGILPERLKILRKAYRLKAEQLISYCSVPDMKHISKTAFLSWERGERIPTFHNLCSYAGLFGVSLDWLAGLTDAPYTEHTVRALENRFPLDEDEVSGRMAIYEKMLPRFGRIAIENYLIPSHRKEAYPLPARANIIVLNRRLRTVNDNMEQELIKSLVFREESVPLDRDAVIGRDAGFIQLLNEIMTDGRKGRRLK